MPSTHNLHIYTICANRFFVRLIRFNRASNPVREFESWRGANKMALDVGKLLADLNSADEAIFSLVSQKGEIDFDDLKNLDVKLQYAFDSLLSAELSSPEQKLKRVEYLLEQINRNADGCSFMQKLTEAVMKDFLSFSETTLRKQTTEQYDCGERETERFFSIGSQ